MTLPFSDERSALFFHVTSCFVLSAFFITTQSFFVNPGIGVPCSSSNSTANCAFFAFTSALTKKYLPSNDNFSVVSVPSSRPTSTPKYS